MGLALSRIHLAYTFFYEVSSIGSKAPSFKNSKLVSCSRDERQQQPSPLVLFFFPILGCLVAKKIQLSHCFQWIFLRKEWVDSSFIHLLIFSLFGFG